MGLMSRLLGRGFGRRRGMLADDRDEDSETPPLVRPRPTPTIRPIKRPADTPTTRPPGGFGSTVGTPSYGTPHGTPSTQRIHNPTRPGR
jgi:hypothetical protein